MLISALTYLQQHVKLIFADLLMQSKIGICKIAIPYFLEQKYLRVCLDWQHSKKTLKHFRMFPNKIYRYTTK